MTNLLLYAHSFGHILQLYHALKYFKITNWVSIIFSFLLWLITNYGVSQTVSLQIQDNTKYFSNIISGLFLTFETDQFLFLAM